MLLIFKACLHIFSEPWRAFGALYKWTTFGRRRGEKLRQLEKDNDEKQLGRFRDETPKCVITQMNFSMRSRISDNDFDYGLDERLCFYK